MSAAIRASFTISHRESRDSAASPCGLEIEATSDAIDIEAFAREVEARHFAALHCFEVDFFEPHAAAGNELVLADDAALNANSSR